MLFFLRIVAVILSIWFLSAIESNVIISFFTYKITFHTAFLLLFIVFILWVLLSSQYLMLKLRWKRKPKISAKKIATPNLPASQSSQAVIDEEMHEFLTQLNKNTMQNYINSTHKLIKPIFIEYNKYSNKHANSLLDELKKLLLKYPDNKNLLKFIIYIYLDKENRNELLNFIKNQKKYFLQQKQYNNILARSCLFRAFDDNINDQHTKNEWAQKSHNFFPELIWGAILVSKTSNKSCKKLLWQAFNKRQHPCLAFLLIDILEQKSLSLNNFTPKDKNVACFIETDLAFHGFLNNNNSDNFATLKEKLDRLNASNSLISHSYYIAKQLMSDAKETTKIKLARNVIRQSCFNIFSLSNPFIFDIDQWHNYLFEDESELPKFNGNAIFPTNLIV